MVIVLTNYKNFNKIATTDQNSDDQQKRNSLLMHIYVITCG